MCRYYFSSVVKFLHSALLYDSVQADEMLHSIEFLLVMVVIYLNTQQKQTQIFEVLMESEPFEDSVYPDELNYWDTYKPLTFHLEQMENEWFLSVQILHIRFYAYTYKGIMMRILVSRLTRYSNTCLSSHLS